MVDDSSNLTSAADMIKKNLTEATVTRSTTNVLYRACHCHKNVCLNVNFKQEKVYANSCRIGIYLTKTRFMHNPPIDTIPETSIQKNDPDKEKPPPESPKIISTSHNKDTQTTEVINEPPPPPIHVNSQKCKVIEHLNNAEQNQIINNNGSFVCPYIPELKTYFQNCLRSQVPSPVNIWKSKWDIFFFTVFNHISTTMRPDNVNVNSTNGSLLILSLANILIREDLALQQREYSDISTSEWILSRLKFLSLLEQFLSPLYNFMFASCVPNASSAFSYFV